MTNLSSYRFPNGDIVLKPGKISGNQALALAYCDTRSYQDALDSAGVVWATHIVAVSDKAVIVTLSIDGISRSACGEDSDLMSAEARGFKRAASAHGLGRYLYSVDLGWQPYDGKRFAPAAYDALQRALVALDTTSAPVEEWQGWSGPEDAYRWAVSAGVVNAIPHAKNALKKMVAERFDGKMTMNNWPEVAKAFFHERYLREAEKAAA